MEDQTINFQEIVQLQSMLDNLLSNRKNTGRYTNLPVAKR
jgi:hypothetical protein